MVARGDLPAEPLRLRLLAEGDVDAVLAFERENRWWFERWVPPRPETYFEADSLARIIRSLVDEQAGGGGRFYLVLDEAGRLVARVNLRRRGGIESGRAQMGYRVAAEAVGRGVATGAVRMVVHDVFSCWGIERLEACTVLGNAASDKVLMRNGFVLVRREPGGFELHGRKVDRLDYVLERRKAG